MSKNIGKVTWQTSVMLIETLKQFFPVFSKVHKEKQSNQYNSSASDSERDSRSKDNENLYHLK